MCLPCGKEENSVMTSRFNYNLLEIQVHILVVKFYRLSKQYCGSRGEVRMCSVWFAGAWKTLAEEVPFKIRSQRWTGVYKAEKRRKSVSCKGSSMCKGKGDKSLQDSGQRGIQWG